MVDFHSLKSERAGRRAVKTTSMTLNACAYKFKTFKLALSAKIESQSHLCIYLEQYNDGGNEHAIRVNGNQNISSSYFFTHRIISDCPRIFQGI